MSKRMYLVDGSEHYCEESDKFKLGSSCVKLVIDSNDRYLLVIADDDQFSPTSIYKIDRESLEIISEKRYITSMRNRFLIQKYNNIMKNVNRGIIPKGIKDRRYKPIKYIENIKV